MKYKGIVFDFNGTLFWDTKLHNEAWDIFLEKYGFYLTDEQKFRTMHGKNNKDILFELFGRDTSEDKIASLELEKETLYQNICLKIDMEMAPGVVDFLDFLKKSEIPFTIATASNKFNVDFYFKHLEISKWFDYDKVVYNDGTIKGKPNPEIYEKAISVIGLNPSHVVVFEDAIAGLQAASNANAGNIVIVNSNDDDYAGWEKYQIITDFNQVDRNMFL